jgi:Na+-translocating ferredoxin:NAD+ oxidoreductase RnfC subunit
MNMETGVKESIFQAGVVGAGGAGFPAHIKIDCKVQTVIANGAECEPLLRVDQLIMKHFAHEVVGGLQAVMAHTGAKKGVIALKKHYALAIAALQAAIKGTGIKLLLLKSFYPAGDEQEIIYEATGRVVPTGGLPADVGALVFNVSTLKNIFKAINGEPVVSKYVTVCGAVHKPVTILAPIGTSVNVLIDAAGGMTGPGRVVIGGPCMGALAEVGGTVVTKTTGGVLCLPEGHMLLSKKADLCPPDMKLAKSVCCQCQICTQICPRNALGLHVLPNKAMLAVANSDGKLLSSYNGIFSCSECGLCTLYACNFGLKPSAVMQILKRELLACGEKPQKEVYCGVDGGKEAKKVPVSRLIARLDVSKYDVEAPMGPEISARSVRIPLKMHVGAPGVPVVQADDTVQKGDLIAEAAGGISARTHASITGTVRTIGRDFIEIRE